MTTPRDILDFVEAKTANGLREDEDITFGPRTRDVNGVTVTWMINPDTIAAAVAAGHNTIVHHEALTYPYPGLPPLNERHYLSWPTNVQRLKLLAEHDLTAIRLHGSLDEVYIFDAIIKQLGVGKVMARDDTEPWARVFASPVGTYGELIEHVKKAVGMDGLRVTHNSLDHPVRCIGLPWGGMGLFVNVAYMQALIDLGADTLVCGETDNYGFRFAAELGIPVIETSHEVSEVRGLADFTADLGRQLKLDASFVDTPCVFRMA